MYVQVSNKVLATADLIQHRLFPLHMSMCVFLREGFLDQQKQHHLGIWDIYIFRLPSDLLNYHRAQQSKS